MKKVYLETWGCQMNFHDSERVLGLLRQKGFMPVDDPKEADLILFNTCSIREKAEHKFLSRLGRTKGLKKRNPSLKIGVLGCIAQQSGEKLKEKAPYVDYVIGPQNISRVGEALELDEGVLTGENPEIALSDIPAYRESTVTAWVNIMYGCNNFCSYCIVPYTRGRERSRPAKNIIREVEELVERGYREVTLLGQNVNSYKGEVTFAELLRMINSIEGLERIRFVTSHPKDLGPELVQAMAECERVCEHIHLPLQSGSDRVLKLMNRKYTFSEYMEKIRMLREAIPGIAITTDIIAGFPAETDDDHKATINALKEIEFDGIFAFKYSKRPYTKASQMEGQLPEEVKSERLNQILRLQDEITEKKNQLLKATVQDVLVEGKNDTGQYTGRTRTNKIVNISQTDELKPGQIVKVLITRPHRHSLKGRLV